MGQTLLEKAKSLKPKRKNKNTFGDEEYELGISLIKGEISYRDVQTVMEFKNINSVYGLLIYSFKRYHEETNRA